MPTPFEYSANYVHAFTETSACLDRLPGNVKAEPYAYYKEKNNHTTNDYYMQRFKNIVNQNTPSVYAIGSPYCYYGYSVWGIDFSKDGYGWGPGALCEITIVDSYNKVARPQNIAPCFCI